MRARVRFLAKHGEEIRRCDASSYRRISPSVSQRCASRFLSLPVEDAPVCPHRMARYQPTLTCSVIHPLRSRPNPPRREEGPTKKIARFFRGWRPLVVIPVTLRALPYTVTVIAGSQGRPCPSMQDMSTGATNRGTRTVSQPPDKEAKSNDQG